MRWRSGATIKANPLRGGDAKPRASFAEGGGLVTERGTNMQSARPSKGPKSNAPFKKLRGATGTEEVRKC